MSKQPSLAQKYLALSCFLPVLADFIEDLRDTNVFRHELTQKGNLLVNSIRRADQKFFERNAFEEITDEEYQARMKALGDQQMNAGAAFRNWIANEIFDPYAEGAVHSGREGDSNQEEGQANNSSEPVSDDPKPKSRSTGGRKKKTD